MVSASLVKSATVMAMILGSQETEAIVRLAREVDTQAVARLAEERDDEDLMRTANFISCVAGMNLDVVTHEMIRDTCYPPPGEDEAE